MDMLYSRYSNPWDLMAIYINQGRFGDFVAGFCEAEHKRKVEEAERHEDLKLWFAYVLSFSKDSFDTFKSNVCKPQNGQKSPRGGNDDSLDDEGIKSIIQGLFPDDSPHEGGE